VLDPVRAWRLGWEARVTADIVPCTRTEFDEEEDEHRREEIFRRFADHDEWPARLLQLVIYSYATKLHYPTPGGGSAIER
jgi:hypothetical protein